MQTPTCDVERGVAAGDGHLGARVGRHAVVFADVRLVVLVVDDAQEEELTRRQQHPVRRRVLIGCDDRLTVPIPRDHLRSVTSESRVTSKQLHATPSFFVPRTFSGL